MCNERRAGRGWEKESTKKKRRGRKREGKRSCTPCRASERARAKWKRVAAACPVFDHFQGLSRNLVSSPDSRASRDRRASELASERASGRADERRRVTDASGSKYIESLFLGTRNNHCHWLLFLRRYLLTNLGPPPELLLINYCSLFSTFFLCSSGVWCPLCHRLVRYD